MKLKKFIMIFYCLRIALACIISVKIEENIIKYQYKIDFILNFNDLRKLLQYSLICYCNKLVS